MFKQKSTYILAVSIFLWLVFDRFPSMNLGVQINKLLFKQNRYQFVVLRHWVVPDLRASRAFISSIRPPLPPLVRLASFLATELSSGCQQTERSQIIEHRLCMHSTSTMLHAYSFQKCQAHLISYAWLTDIMKYSEHTVHILIWTEYIDTE